MVHWALLTQEVLNNNSLGDFPSLVAQWLRICLTMQGTRVRALVWEDSTCRGATKPCATLLSLHATITEPVHLEPMLRNKQKPPQ